jgi:tetratricopeptide (TPR) repeat protein
LYLAAVAGRKIDISILRAAEPDAALESWLTACANAAVLEVDDGRWRFAHDKLRDGLLSEMPEGERPVLHRRVAEAIERVYPNEPEQAGALAFHWAKAGDTEKEARYMLLAGQQALASGAYQKALSFLERALELEEQAEAADKPMPELAQLRRQLGETCYGLGDYARARELLYESLKLSMVSGDMAGLARSMNILGNIALAFGEYNEAKQLLEQSIAMCQSSGNRLELGKATRSLGVVLDSIGERAEAKKLFEESLTILTEVNDHLGMAGALTNLATLARDEGDHAEARRLFEAGLAQFEAIDFAWGIAYTLTSLGLSVDALGEHHEARALHERALAICRQIGHKWGMAYSLTNLANSCFACYAFADTKKHLIEALRITLDIQTLPQGLDAIASYGRLMSTAGANDYAVELFTHVLENPLTEAETQVRVRDYLSTAQLALSGHELEEAQTRAREKTFADIAEGIIKTSDGGLS